MGSRARRARGFRSGAPNGRTCRTTARNKKRAAFRPLFVLSLEKDYFFILRRSTIASAPKPSRLIVAGSGTATMSPFRDRSLMR